MKEIDLPMVSHDQKSATVFTSWTFLCPMRPFSIGTMPLNAKFAFSTMSNSMASSRP